MDFEAQVGQSDNWATTCRNWQNVSFSFFWGCILLIYIEVKNAGVATNRVTSCYHVLAMFASPSNPQGHPNAPLHWAFHGHRLAACGAREVFPGHGCGAEHPRLCLGPILVGNEMPTSLLANFQGAKRNQNEAGKSGKIRILLVLNLPYPPIFCSHLSRETLIFRLISSPVSWTESLAGSILKFHCFNPHLIWSNPSSFGSNPFQKYPKMTFGLKLSLKSLNQISELRKLNEFHWISMDLIMCFFHVLSPPSQAPSIPGLECSTAEEAMALAQVELARLQGPTGDRWTRGKKGEFIGIY